MEKRLIIGQQEYKRNEDGVWGYDQHEERPEDVFTDADGRSRVNAVYRPVFQPASPDIQEQLIKMERGGEVSNTEKFKEIAFAKVSVSNEGQYQVELEDKEGNRFIRHDKSCVVAMEKCLEALNEEADDFLKDSKACQLGDEECESCQ